MSTPRAEFVLRTRNPDVLTCIANLSNDEVFTPPELANAMLDNLEKAWADGHGGAGIWADETVTFLDPFTKSGVFLRQITSRLIKGLETKIPDLQTRVDHILSKQVFGIGITDLTAMLARRSLYCSKSANGPHSVTTCFDDDAGNVWFQRVEHTWVGGTDWAYTVDKNGKRTKKSTNGKCKYCGASQKALDRGDQLESHAYAFIHTDNIKARLGELFGDRMQFDVIIGNPPYQMTGGGGGSNDSSIYHLFVQQAKALDPRYLAMVIPSRWLAGGRGMDEFRKQMLTDRHLRRFVDYTKMSTAFPGVDFEGGVGYFLRDRDNAGPCLYTLMLGDQELETVERNLDSHEVFIRDSRAAIILDKVLAFDEPTMDKMASGDTPFGLATNFSEFANKPFKGSLELHVSVRQKRAIVFMKDTVTKNRHLISGWKLFVPKAYGERGAIPANVLGPSILAGPNAVCTQTYISVGPFTSEAHAASCQMYLRTRFARFLISLRKITQDLPRSVYSWLPQQDWTDTWTDSDLYKKYGITDAEVTLIDSMIRPMVGADVQAD